MNKKVIAGFVMVLAILFAGRVVASTSPSGDPFQAIWDAINTLKQQMASIQLIPGTQGPQGETGSQGEQGLQGEPGSPSWNEERVLGLENRVTELEQLLLATKDVVFFDGSTGLVNGDASEVIETDGFQYLWAYFTQPSNCQQANTAVFMQASPDGVTWANVGPNLCPSYNGNPIKLDVAGKYYRARLSFMNILDNNPKPPVTVKGFLT